MKPFSGTLAYLYGLQHRGMKFGLRNVRYLLQEAGNPERRFPSIHIAGTNGKGSTAAFIASTCMESGLKTGLYTSPHLVHFTERIRIDGEEISEELVIRYVERIRPAIESARATFFEATTCVAFMYFGDRNVDIAILETGLGGRLDATNVVQPLVSVITNISFDHTEYLGRTVRSIAKEKGGIIKESVPCITSSSAPAVVSTLKEIARRKNAPLFESHSMTKLKLLSIKKGAITVALHSRHFSIPRVQIGLMGIHQATNVRLAVGVLDLLKERSRRGGRFAGISSRSVRDGIAHVSDNTGTRGRLELKGGGGRYILDVAHNPAGMEILVRAMSLLRLRNIVALFGVMKDKAYISMLDDLARVSDVIVPVAPRTGRAMSALAIQRVCESRGIPVEHGVSVRKGLEKAEELAGQSGHILVTGSHYVVGEVVQILKKQST